MQEPYIVRSFRAHRDALTTCEFSPNLRYLATGSFDGSICLWNLPHPKQSFKLVGHKGAVQEISFSNNGSFLASASKDATIKIWEVKNDGKFITLRGHSSGVNTVAFEVAGTCIGGIWGGGDRTHTKSVGQVAGLVLSGGDDGVVMVWDSATGELRGKLEGHEAAVNSVRWSSDSKLAVSVGEDGLVKVWDMEIGKEVVTFEEESAINCVRFHPDGSYIATGSSDGAARIYDLRSKAQSYEYKCHIGGVHSLDFHKNAPLLLSGGEDARVRLIDIGESTLKTSINANDISTTCVKFSPEGDYFACGGEDKVSLIWKTNVIDLNLESIKPMNQKLATINNEENLSKLYPKAVVSDSYVSSLKKMTAMPKNADFLYNNRQATGELYKGLGYDPALQENNQGDKNTVNQHFEVEYVLNPNLKTKIDKISTNLETINNTLNIMAERIDSNEKALNSISDYFGEKYNCDLEQEILRQAQTNQVQEAN